MTLAANHPLDVFVAGQGLVAHTTALFLLRAGLRVGIAPAPAVLPLSAGAGATSDIRAFALGAAAQGALAQAGAWSEGYACPLQGMRIHADGQTIGFDRTHNLGAPLAWIVRASALEEAVAAALTREAKATGRLSWQTLDVFAAQREGSAALLAVCEGAGSATRKALGAQWQREAYGATAVAAELVVHQPHRAWARQWMQEAGVLALLPLAAAGGAEDKVSLVWSVTHEKAKVLRECSPPQFEAALRDFLGPIHSANLGPVALQSAVQSWPLAWSIADRWAGVWRSGGAVQPWALLGDAAHTVHPLAGLGLNLGLNDAAALAQCLAALQASKPGALHAAGLAGALRRYARERSLPTQALGWVTHGLALTYGSQGQRRGWMHVGALGGLRHIGLGVLQSAPVLKAWLAQSAGHL